MKATNFLRAGLVLAIGALVSLVSLAKEPADQSKRGQTLAKSAGSPVYAVLNINNLTTWLRADGHSNHSPSADDGFYYPRGTGSALYQDCVVWGGKVYTNVGLTRPGPRQSVRVGGGTYGVGTRAGKILLPDSGAVVGVGVEDPAAASVRIYRIRRDFATMSDAEYARDAAVVNEIQEAAVTPTQIAAVKAQYKLDWDNWPHAKGAPYIDRNGDGVYNVPPAFNTDPLAGPVFTADSLISRGLDEPGVAGGDPNSPADQVIWTVYNDLNVSTSTSFEGSEPMGIEVQKTVWGYKRTDALGNLYFNRYKLINKGGVDTSAATGNQFGAFWIDSMYVCQWSDPDLGNAGDDLLGTDSLRSLGFCYNGNAVDAEYRGFNLPPPAVGYDFLAGPLYNAPGDSAVFNLKRVYGKANRGMSSFSYFSAGSPYSDPPTGSANYLQGTGRWWKMLRGFAPLGDLNTADQPYAHPPGVAITKFPLSGDPVTRTGFVDGLGTPYSFAAGDRRLLCTTGPFSMAPGDTQEIYVGVVAGLGADRLTSVAVMKFNDRFVQNTFNALFQVPRPPASPDVQVAELDGEITLEWGSNLARVADTETKRNEPGGYIFEGYNVYQLPSPNSRTSEGRRIATFDLPTDPTVILDEQFDEGSGQILNLPVQFGSNSGLKRFFNFNRDYINDINKIYNGQEYYLVVTAYSRTTTPGYLPASLESDPRVYTVRPRTPYGLTPIAETNSGLTVTHTTGIGDVPIEVKVIDPTKVNGQTYTIGWSTQPDRFSGHEDLTFDVAGNPVSSLSASMLLDAAGTSVTYTVDLSAISSLAGPVVGLYFDTTGTAGNKGGLPYTVSVGNATATGKWTSTDTSKPFTAGFRQALVGERMYVTVITTVDTSQAQIFFDTYPYYVTKGASSLLTYQQNYSEDDDYPIFDGLQLKVGSPVFKLPDSYSTQQTAGTGTGLDASFYYGFGIQYVNLLPQSTNTTTAQDMVSDIEMRFTGVRATRANGTFPNDTLIVSGGSIATVASSNAANIVRIRVPFELWEVDPALGRSRQINAVVRDRNADAASPWGSGGVPLYLRFGGRAYIGAVSTPYTSDATAAGITAVPRDNPKGTWMFAMGVTSQPLWRTGDVVKISVPNPTTPGTDLYTFTAPAPVVRDAAAEKLDAARVGVFPNPYYAFNAAETNRFQRFVTFNNLPPVAKIRIFNLAGQLVRTLDKNEPSQFYRWNLMNQSGFPVASGMYIVHIELTLPTDGSTVTKILKLGVIQEQEILNTY
ncbi:MAG: T9SS type A sorting domain-containing protein [Bacteroidetes bacterium]|jgi:hypothetical protein|nr:T9SS type A sorting domain-containing protein [Bacteroidota bacterium]